MLLVQVILYHIDAVYLGPAFLAASAASPIFTTIFRKYRAFSDCGTSIILARFDGRVLGRHEHPYRNCKFCRVPSS